MIQTSSLNQILEQEAQAAGFPAFGGVDIELAKAEFEKHADRYDHWIGRGMEGAMSYLSRGKDRRRNLELLLPSAKSVFSVLLPYQKKPLGQIDSKLGPRYARYLDGPDYHDVLKAKLSEMMLKVSKRFENPLQYKVCVDTSAVLERSWAMLSGLGWIGKNTLLIHPKLGSYVFIAEVILDQPLQQGPRPIPDFCGHCDRCLKACPTGAFTAPRDLDSRKCISYLTLEKRGPFEAPKDLLSKMGTWVAGCDICQEVCPFNQKPVKVESHRSIAEPSGDHDSNTSHSATELNDWERLFQETDTQYQNRVKNSALNRVKPDQFKRNLKQAFENSSST